MRDLPNLANVDCVDRVNRAIDHVTRNLDQPLKLEDVAKVACFSSFHFHGVFRMVVGASLAQFVRRVGLERALYLLSHSPGGGLLVLQGRMQSMRFPCLVASALLATGCGVPDVSFTTDAGSRDATRDSAGLDAPAEAEAEASADAPGDANSDASDSSDAGTDAPQFCQDGGDPPPGFPGAMCCQGIVCSGNCNPVTCGKCGSATLAGCRWPSVCCGVMGNGVFCNPPDGGPCP